MIKRNVPTKRSYRPFESMWQFLVFLLCVGTCLFAADIWSMLRGMDSRWAGLCDSVSKTYQRGGAEELRSALQLLEKGMGLHVSLVDKDGRDLATGEERAQLRSAPSNRSVWPLLGPPPTRAILTTSGSCTIDAALRKPIGIPPGLWFLVFLSFACCSVAAYVALRMRHIETAVAEFGAGSMGVRVDTRSKDSMGRLARTFNQMADRIESLLEGNRQLCIDISHELRSPLTRLRLAVGLARSGSVGALQCMETEILRLDELVNTLLDTARAEADVDTLRAEAVSLESLLVDITEGCSIEANDRDCSFNIDVVEAGTLEGDPELLRSALENIVRNAIRHSPRGTTVDIHATRDSAGTIQLCIRDYGTGVPISSLEKIFQPFYRVESDRNRSTGGTGLGLAIAKRIITVHGGSVKAENSNPGLRVAVSFPCS